MGKLILPISPSVNHYLSHYCLDQDRRSTPHRIGVKLTDRAKQYKHDVGWEAKAAGIRMMDGDVRVDIELFVGRTHIDTDNVLKMILDALTGIAWEDDRQVAEIHIRRRRCRKREAAHMEVALSIVEEAN